jgi:hypothetical protein
MIKIEVTGNSIPEVADKLLALGNRLRNSAGVWWEATDAPHKLAEKLRAQLSAEVAEAAPVDPTLARKSAPVADVIESLPTTAEPFSTVAPAASVSETLSFETDVTPVVLAVVQTKGKPVVEEILAQFGVARASQLDPARWPELVAALQDKL